MSKRSDLRDAVSALLTSATFGRTHTVHTNYDASTTNVSETETDVDLFVRVEAAGETPLDRTRGSDLRTLSVGVNIVGAVGNDTAAEVDPILDVAEEVEAVFMSPANSKLTLAGGGQAQWMSVEFEGLVDSDRPREDGLAEFFVATNYLVEFSRG